jgi:phosphoribosyl-ATP pyrophosphohydrolase
VKGRKDSYTSYLFDEGLDKILKKLGEESSETIIAAKNEDRDALTKESCDLLYHLIVLLVERGSVSIACALAGSTKRRTEVVLILPAIDLRQGKCVRLAQGSKNAATAYDRDPIAVAKAFEADGARMLHVVDLDGAFGEGQSVNRDIAKRIIHAVSIQVQFGGGLRTIDDVEALIQAGAGRVVIGTLAAESPETLAVLVERFGPRIVVGIDARDGQVLTRGGKGTARSKR